FAASTLEEEGVQAAFDKVQISENEINWEVEHEICDTNCVRRRSGPGSRPVLDGDCPSQDKPTLAFVVNGAS
ncbi:hypothetical protein, partial [Mesorhizobium sp.]|uniref:hypothetical protein n=1 Tax=Mesorhizobium sp. TaxID=1871066 RepID=UPI0025E06786